MCAYKLIFLKQKPNQFPITKSYNNIMLLKTSISSTRKFFKRTIQGFKSLLSNGYEKLPKTQLPNPFSCAERKFNPSFRDMDNCDRDKRDIVARSESTMLISRSKDFTGIDNSLDIIKAKCNTPQENKKVSIGLHMKRVGENHDRFSSGGSRVMREKRVSLVSRKLKELERVDMRNIEHVLDIEEVLHYYSRITCPVYQDLVDKYFMEVYSDLFNSRASTEF